MIWQTELWVDWVVKCVINHCPEDRKYSQHGKYMEVCGRGSLALNG
jgi:hypothetical protein